MYTAAEQTVAGGLPDDFSLQRLAVEYVQLVALASRENDAAVV